MTDSLIYLEDHGQDFTRWQIKKDIIVGCWPFQSSIWCGWRVLNKRLTLGGFVRLASEEKDNPLVIRYAVTKIVPIGAATFVCPRCGTFHNRGPLNGADAYRCLQCGQTYDKAADDQKIAEFITKHAQA